MPRIRLDLAYDGTAFSGWSTQSGLRTVQGELEAALATVLRTAPPRLTVAGRTDAGVHASGQVAHLDLDDEQLAALARPHRPKRHSEKAAGVDPLAALRRRLNGIAGADGDVHVHRISLAPDGFDARFSASWRRYEYRIADAAAVHDPLRRSSTLWWPSELDLDRIRAAAAPLPGLADWAAYCKPREGATTIRTLLDFGWRRDADGVVLAEVRADAFCHSMVRALVGAAIAVGEGRVEPERMLELRDAPAGRAELPVAAAKGLCLVEVAYPEPDELAARAEQTRARRAVP